MEYGMVDKVRGIDVSNHQGLIDWDAVAGAGYNFAFMKATQGTNFKDAWFPQNWEGAKRVGMQRGAYHFMEPYNNKDARDEADFFWKYVVEDNGFEETDMLVLDAETTNDVYNGDYGEWCAYWLQIIQSYTEYTPLIYTAKKYINDLNLTTPRLSEFGLWLAQWIINIANPGNIPSPPANSPWNLTAFWQYTDKGRVPGVSTLCDMNLFNGSLDQMKLYGKLAIENPPPPQQIDVEAVRGLVEEIDQANANIQTQTSIIQMSTDQIRELLRGTNTPS
jgi:lysozyme